jgi:NADP-dependent 3-hydroxy acid dehydrogenase YdfG
VDSTRRKFTLSDQYWFAEASGDANPVHLDADWAATVYPGKIVVHGLHVFIWALDSYFAARTHSGFMTLRASFLKPVLLNDEVEMDSDQEGLGFRILLGGELMVVAKFMSEVGPSLVPPRAPDNRADTEFSETEGAVDFPVGSVALDKAFPAAAAAIGPAALRGLAAISTMVGMRCPGLRGMLSEFCVTIDKSEIADQLEFRVRKYDDMFSRVEIDVAGLGLAGTVSAFVGRQPAQPPTDAELRASVLPAEFAGQNPLIIGASSGLGATTARLLAAGGARPTLTWHRSGDAGRALADDLARSGAGCDLINFDVREPAAGLADLAQRRWRGGQVYYFATPRIFRRRVEPYQSTDLHDFLEVYVDGFYNLIRGLMGMTDDRRLTIFYPSTTAVSEPTDDLVEYSIAKMAAEKLCMRLHHKYRQLKIVVSRLPRIETRQTLSNLPLKASSSFQIMLPIVRSVQTTSIG